MALEMVAAICGDSAIKWREAEETAVSADEVPGAVLGFGGGDDPPTAV